jgi:hypothetical protein
LKKSIYKGDISGMNMPNIAHEKRWGIFFCSEGFCTNGICVFVWLQTIKAEECHILYVLINGNSATA